MSEQTPGQRLYHRWCDSTVSDQARYWHSMNPADKRAWERLAVEVTGAVAAAALYTPPGAPT